MGYSKRPAVMKGPFVHESESVCECKQPRGANEGERFKSMLLSLLGNIDSKSNPFFNVHYSRINGQSNLRVLTKNFIYISRIHLLTIVLLLLLI